MSTFFTDDKGKLYPPYKNIECIRKLIHSRAELSAHLLFFHVQEQLNHKDYEFLVFVLFSTKTAASANLFFTYYILKNLL